MKTRTLTSIALGMILAVAIAVSYSISRPFRIGQEKSIPIFMGEEITIQKANKTSSAKATVVKAITAVKTKNIPAPPSKAATPLPIFPPKITYSILPRYPMSALNQDLEGRVLLSLYIGSSGFPEKIEKKISSGISELDQAAVAAISQWKFAPASQGGQTIGSWFEVPISFKIEP